MEFLQEYIVPITLVAAWCVGFVVKRWIEDVNNKWIPTICAFVGVGFNIWVVGEVTPLVVLGGFASGIAATGIDQAVKQLKNKE